MTVRGPHLDTADSHVRELSGVLSRHAHVRASPTVAHVWLAGSAGKRARIQAFQTCWLSRRRCDFDITVSGNHPRRGPKIPRVGCAEQDCR